MQPPIRTASHVDLDRFMGSWYVIAHIPTFIEKEAINAVESYELDEDGTIATTFRFNQGAFDGPEKIYTPRGFVRDDESNAVWGMRFVWPFKAEFRVVYVDDDYSTTVIGRTKRDYVWIMARQPMVAPDRYQMMVDMLANEGYDNANLRRVPQDGEGTAFLQQLEWKARPVLLFAADASSPKLLEAQAAVRARRHDFDEREMRQLIVLDSEVSLGSQRAGPLVAEGLRARFNVGRDEFVAVLVGKDGQEKRRTDQLSDLTPWFDLIDTMPLRRQEISNRQLETW